MKSPLKGPEIPAGKRWRADLDQARMNNPLKVVESRPRPSTVPAGRRWRAYLDQARMKSPLKGPEIPVGRRWRANLDKARMKNPLKRPVRLAGKRLRADLDQALHRLAKEADETVYQWLIDPHNKIGRACSLLYRLYDDTRTDECEEKRGQLSGRDFYMKHYGVSKEEAIEGYKALIEEAWKDLNEAWMRPWPVPKLYFSLAFYFAPLCNVTYEEDDGYSRPENTFKHFITQAFIDPIPL
ncbi:hypothetical protein COLO4_20506 [Corchorus olitorius]|uniref:Terpene synthase metal-binding domain-containing protein n=1 Tax=Corchorus olitorius TaxID=93759 RepID=A0A1R3IZL7_9ROSI|nr:hypothetical protein COLO4_20506 [Corchorus olitorius]